MRRETPAFAQQKWPGGYLYHYGLRELAQRQAVLLRMDKSPDRAIKSYRAKVVMTAGCISRIFDIPNYIYNPREIGNSTNQNFSKQKGMIDINKHPSCHKFKENVPTQPPAHLEHQRSLLSVP